MEKSQGQQTVLTELSSLISLLESDIPANPDAPRNLQLADRLEAAMRDYFAGVEQALDMKALEQIYNRHVKAD